MAYVAIKPCKFAGQAFLIGDTVPDEVIHPGNAKNLVKMGLIAPTGETATAPAKVKEVIKKEPVVITIHTDDGDLKVEPTANGLQGIFDVLTGTAAKAESTIKQMTDPESLLLLHVSDSRKSVKNLAEERAKEISEAGEQ